MLSKIYLKSEEYSDWSLSDSDCLDGLNKINIYIGENNSGKSRFLRKIFFDNNFKFQLTKLDLKALEETLEALYVEINSILEAFGLAEIGGRETSGLKETLKQWIQKAQSVDINSISSFSKDFYLFWNEMMAFNAMSASHLRHSNVQPRLYEVGNYIIDIATRFDNKIKYILPADIQIKLERIYIPILRGLRPIQLTGEKDFTSTFDNYYTRTSKDYYNGPDENLKKQIYTGLGLYEDLKKKLLGKQEDRVAVRKFELFLGQTFFNSEPVSLIPNINDDSVHVTIGDEERPIYNLGDGIQSLIILLYPLFFNQGKDLLVFIEEPETSLHPGLQRLFIETLLKPEFSSFQYFFTTHSNHFLDITLELDKISVFTFRKIRNENSFKFKIDHTSNADVRILDLIGARTASVFLSNCTIWVEGITDRLYLKKYLEIFQKELMRQNQLKSLFKEDYNYSFVEYGGGNVVHWSFADESNWEKIKANRISSKIFLIADTDNTSTKNNSAKKQRLQLLKDQLGKNFRKIDGREIENTLSPNILIKSIRQLEKENSSNVKFIESDIELKKYKFKKIGTFIKSHFQGLTRKYEAKSGTIYPKLDFCKAAIENSHAYSDLTEEAKNLAQDMFNFIKDNNQ